MPKGSLVQRYLPQGVCIVVRKEDSSVNLIVWNASLISKVEKILALWKR